MSVKVTGFKSSEVFEQLKINITDNETKKKEIIKKINAIYEFNVKNEEGKTQIWTIDLKKGVIQSGKGSAEPDISINLSDDTFVQLASGKLNGQKAFMSGKIKVEGNMMLATKLDSILSSIPRAKL
ncbi:12681_t:CDS:2 [Acaulospora colombiana]|uniref:12681_t:CDS:1 n=1 Tax=Acaulospora colombiana TaxID=27376 RepID=A0ACA9KGH0_9GLOM|nr:12681_t:CDS:2 [Acaulospora colombiana]